MKVPACESKYEIGDVVKYGTSWGDKMGIVSDVRIYGMKDSKKDTWFEYRFGESESWFLECAIKAKYVVVKE